MPAADPEDVEALAAAMAEDGYNGEDVVLAVPSEWCLSASAVMSSRRITRNRQAVAYAVEEQLPLAAEGMVCDYLVNQSEVFSVTSDTAQLLPVVRALEEAGIMVASISPAAMLVLQQLDAQRRVPKDGLLLLADDTHCDLFLLSRARPCLWRWLPRDANDVYREVGAYLLSHTVDEAAAPLPVSAFNLGEASQALQELESDLRVSNQTCDVPATLRQAATDVLLRGRRPWIELRRDQIGQYDPYKPVRGSMQFLLVAALLLLASVTYAVWTLGDKYQAATLSLEDQKRELFRELFPGTRVPTGVRSRLQSERRRLSGVSGADEEPADLVSVTETLANALACLPTDLRYRLLEIDVEQGAVSLDGEARQHGDIAPIVNSLQENGFDVEPAQTEQLADDGVGFTLHVSVRATDAAEKQTTK